MRTKEDILQSTRDDIQSDTDKEIVRLWIEYRKIEVLIDIRDQIHDTNYTLDNLLDPNLKKALREAGLLKE